jgi:hypothetical protein
VLVTSWLRVDVRSGSARAQVSLGLREGATHHVAARHALQAPGETSALYHVTPGNYTLTLVRVVAATLSVVRRR